MKAFKSIMDSIHQHDDFNPLYIVWIALHQPLQLHLWNSNESLLSLSYHVFIFFWCIPLNKMHYLVTERPQKNMRLPFVDDSMKNLYSFQWKPENSLCLRFLKALCHSGLMVIMLETFLINSRLGVIAFSSISHRVLSSKRWYFSLTGKIKCQFLMFFAYGVSPMCWIISL